MARLETGSLPRLTVHALAVVVVGVLLTALTSAATMLYVSHAVRHQSDLVVALQVANRDLFQDVSEAERGLHGYAVDGRREALQPYIAAMSWLPEHQAHLDEAAAEDARLREAVAEQSQVVRRWLRDYVDPQLAPGVTARERAVLHAQGEGLFSDIRLANERVDKRLGEVTEDVRADTSRTLTGAVGAVALLPIIMGVGVLLVGRRFQRVAVAPLLDVAAVLDRLRAGDEQARARVEGPWEVRQIAAGLNSLTEENQRASAVEADVLRELESIDRVRNDLVSTVSHELRTPLTSMKGYLELLQDELEGRIDESERMMMAAVLRNADRLAELVNNLLALSRAEETALEVVPLDLRVVAQEVATDLRLTAASRDITLSALVAPSPVTVLGDRSQLVRAVQNLVSNAVKFSRPGGAVEVRVAKDDDGALVEVVDEGIGIPAPDLAGLGSRFYRASNAMRAEIAGTGLGLRIVQTILDRHGGRLAVDSVEGEGSTFTMRMPLSRELADSLAVGAV